MKPGPELDALVAEKVMGLGNDWCLHVGVHPPCGSPCPIDYSTDIAAAWQVVEKIGNASLVNHASGGAWHVEFELKGGSLPYDTGDTAPHAICLAALKAVGVELAQETAA